ncbi:MAG: hypothetical protein V2B14_00830 [bacterium]
MKCNPDKYKKLNKKFKIIAFDWDGTAVVDRTVDASLVTNKIEELLKLGIYIVVITGTNFENIDKQFSSLINGKHKQNLYICANRGSEVYGFDDKSRQNLLYIRKATEKENYLLDKIVEKTKEDIEKNSNIKVNIIYNRLNRRKLDLITEWKNPKKYEIDKLLFETQNRLEKGGFAGGIHRAFKLMQDNAKKFNLLDAKITSDVKHIEIGLTDKSDSIKWIINNIAEKKNISNKEIIIGGDEFGSIGSFEGSDYRMILKDYPGITYFTVGIEPNGVDDFIVNIGGGPDCFVEILTFLRANIF